MVAGYLCIEGKRRLLPRYRKKKSDLSSPPTTGKWKIPASLGGGVGICQESFDDGFSACFRGSHSQMERSPSQMQRKQPWTSRTPTAHGSRCRSFGMCCMRGMSLSPRCFCCKRSWPTIRGESRHHDTLQPDLRSVPVCLMVRHPYRGHKGHTASGLAVAYLDKHITGRKKKSESFSTAKMSVWS